MPELLDDEIVSINSIYGPDTLRDEGSDLCILKLPAKPEITIRVEFSSDYPDAPPSILGTESTGSDTAKGQGQHVVDVLRSILAEVFVSGSPCIFNLIEESTTRIEQLGLFSPKTEDGRAQTHTGGQGIPIDDQISPIRELGHAEDIGKEPPWILSEVVTEKKSVFVARAAQVDSPEQAKQYLHYLLVTDKRVARATHNITAWRIQGAKDVQYQDCDDDGETAAGGRLLHLLELMSVWNVMVVVTRWYGGVHLGPDRFRIINQVARDAVVQGGWGVEHGSKKKSKK